MSWTRIIAIILCIAMPAWAEPIRIGLITDLSGPMAFWGKSVQAGALMALEDSQKGGVSAEIIFGDHQLRPTSALSEASKLLDIDKVQALYVEFTPTSVAVATLAARYAAPTIYSAAATSPLKSGSNIYKTYIDYVDGCALAARDLKVRGINSVGMLKSTLEFGDLCLEGIRSVFPNPIVVEYNAGDDVRTQVLTLKSKGIQAVFNSTFTPDFSRMIKAMQAIHYAPYVIANQDAISADLSNEFPDIMAKSIAFALPALSTEFIERYKKSYPAAQADTFNAGALGYIHTKQLLNALSACSPKDSVCALQGLSNAKPQPEFGFEGWKERQAKFTLRLIPGGR